MTIIKGTDLRSNKERLNPKIFSKNRTVYFSGERLEDSQTQRYITLIDYTRDISNSFTYQCSLDEYQSSNEVTTSIHNVVTVKENVPIAYFRKDHDRIQAFNNTMSIDIKNIVMDSLNFIGCDIEITIQPYNKYIYNISALYTKLCEYFGVDTLNSLEISDSYFQRKPMSITISNIKMDIDKDDNSRYIGTFDHILSTVDQKYKFDMSFKFVYDDINNVFDIEFEKFSIIGLFFNDNPANIFFERTSPVPDPSNYPLPETNTHFEYIAVARDTEIWTLIDGFSIIESLNSKSVTLRNLNNTPVTIDMMSFDDRGIKSINSTQTGERYLAYQK